MKETRVKNILKLLSFGTLAIVVVVMMGATIVEKLYGTQLVLSKIYTAPWMIALWGVAAVSALGYLLLLGFGRRLRILFMHLAFGVILLGALVSHLTGREGVLHLREGESVTRYYLRGGGEAELGFELRLDDFELKYYEGTRAPMDYVSHISITDAEGTIRDVVAMNNIVRHNSHRIYQSGYDEDAAGATLMISYDPYGIAITYLGYALLLLSFILFFFEPNTIFRQLLNSAALRRLSLFAGMLLLSASAMAADRPLPRTLSPEAADAFCDICVYHNDRIAPLETFAVEFTTKICGKAEYRGLSAEQVLTGWFFFFDEWQDEPCIKLKGKDVAALLGVEGRYARLVDFTANARQIDRALRGEVAVNRKNVELASEKFNLVRMLCMGVLLRIFPYSDPSTGELVWYSLADTLPEDMPQFEQLFIRKSLHVVAEAALAGDNDAVIETMNQIGTFQMQRVEALHPRSRIDAERLYNSLNYNRVVAMVCLTLGIISLFVFCLVRRETRLLRWLRVAIYCVMTLVALYLTLHIALRYYISGHIPLASGFETMQFMAWCSALLTLALGRKFPLALPSGVVVAGFTLLVAMLGEATPRITQLMPVLHSPLLSIHVMVIMISYTLFAFMMLNGLTAMVLHLVRGAAARHDIEYMYVVSRIMLYPAVMLLAVGIFVGAVWANVSWGRYWGWDPKEVWALITMLIYAALMHTQSLGALRRPMTFHLLSIVAFLAVLVTYFGVNFLLGGMHSYA